MRTSLEYIIPFWLLMVLWGCSQESLKKQTSELYQLPPSDSMLFWSDQQQLNGFRNIDRIFPTRKIDAGSNPYPLIENHIDLSNFSYNIKDSTYSLNQFIEHNHIAGLLIIKDGEIVMEHYEQGNTPDTKWISFSVAKSVVSLLIGAAVKDGYISNVDDPITDYLPIMKGSEYEAVSIRQAMQMSSGIQWNEDYTDPESDVNRSLSMSTLEILKYLSNQPRIAAPGEKFNYNTAETHLIGAVVRAAIGNNLSNYLSSKIWEPFGMESDANWMLMDPYGAENGGCCISAILRDYGRIGLFVLKESEIEDENSVLPKNWITDISAPSNGSDRYASLWWIPEENVFCAIGIFGQMIWIDPAENLIVVTHCTWPEATAFFSDGYEFSSAVRDYLND